MHPRVFGPACMQDMLLCVCEVGDAGLCVPGCSSQIHEGYRFDTRIILRPPLQCFQWVARGCAGFLQPACPEISCLFVCLRYLGVSLPLTLRLNLLLRNVPHVFACSPCTTRVSGNQLIDKQPGKHTLLTAAAVRVVVLCPHPASCLLTLVCAVWRLSGP